LLKHIPPIWWIAAPSGYGIYWFCFQRTYTYYEAYNHSTAAPVILNYTWPVFTVLFYQLLYESNVGKPGVRLIEYLSLMLCMAGVAILATEGRFAGIGNLPGILYGLLTGASYGLFSAHSRTLGGIRQLAYLLFAVASSLLLMTAMLGYQAACGTLQWELSLTDIQLAFVSGCVVESAGYLAWTQALRLSVQEQVPLSRIAARMYVLPLLSLGMVAAWFHETTLTEPYCIGAIVCVLAGAIAVQQADSIARILRLQR
jgi:positive regulator of sigma E activity